MFQKHYFTNKEEMGYVVEIEVGDSATQKAMVLGRAGRF